LPVPPCSSTARRLSSSEIQGIENVCDVLGFGSFAFVILPRFPHSSDPHTSLDEIFACDLTSLVALAGSDPSKHTSEPRGLTGSITLHCPLQRHVHGSETPSQIQVSKIGRRMVMWSLDLAAKEHGEHSGRSLNAKPKVPLTSMYQTLYSNCGDGSAFRVPTSMRMPMLMLCMCM
jgi:hypothetical protein